MQFDLSCATATLLAKLPVQRHMQTMLAEGQGTPGMKHNCSMPQTIEMGQLTKHFI